MAYPDILKFYDFAGKTIAITGGAGVLCAVMARALAQANANVVILDRNVELGNEVIASFGRTAGKHRAILVDVLNRSELVRAADTIVAEYGRIDGLINGAGGNDPKATTSPHQTFFDLPGDAIEFVTNLNLLGTIVPCQVIGKHMAAQREGVILNVSSMNAFRPLTRIPAYSAAKAAVTNFTQWLAVHLAQEYSTNIRVNAIAPGFFLTEQNRFLLTDPGSGELTARGNQIIAHTPLKRFGEPNDLVWAALWLLSHASAFVTGIVVPVDGGFSAFGGV